MGSTKVNLPPQPKYGETSREILKTQIELAPELYASEAKYQPLYQELQDRIQRQSALAQLAMFKELEPGYSDLEKQYLRSQRIAQQQALQEQAPGYIEAFQRATGVAPVVEGMRKYAADLQSRTPQYDISPEEKRAIEQNTRAAYASRGTALGDQAALGEVLNRYQFQRQRRLEEDQLQAQRQTMAANLGMGIQQQAAPALQSFYGQPLYAGNFAGNTVQSALMGQQQAGPQLFNPESQTGMGLAGGAYNAAVQGAIGKAGAGNQMMGDLAKTVGTVAATYFAAGCHVAREVYGVDNPMWLLFREWLMNDAPAWFRGMYIKYGQTVAAFISNKPALKTIIRSWMDKRIQNYGKTN